MSRIAVSSSGNVLLGSLSSKLSQSKEGIANLGAQSVVRCALHVEILGLHDDGFVLRSCMDESGRLRALHRFDEGVGASC